MNVLVHSLRDLVVGNVFGLLIFAADIIVERAISNLVNRRIAMYIFHMLFALPIFLIMRHNMRHDQINFQKESQADTLAYAMSFFSVGLGLYLGYVVRSYMQENVANGK